MGALELGLLAAMCWGFHDVCVRFISQKTPISACIFIVLIVGLIFHICLMMPSKEISTITKAAFTYASIAGVSFVIASFSLYYAFKRGPVGCPPNRFLPHSLNYMGNLDWNTCIQIANFSSVSNHSWCKHCGYNV